MFNITPSFPSPILKDFQIFINYCEKNLPKVTKSNEFIGRKDVFALNELMEQKEEGLTARNDQNHYPLLHLFYHLSIQGELFFIARKKSTAHFSPNKEKLNYFKKLNSTEQYFYLFKTFFVYCDWENIQLQDRASINKFGLSDLFEWCSMHEANELISFDAQMSNDGERLSWVLHSLEVVIIYLEYFGFWKCKISDRYRTRTHISAESVVISEFGIQMSNGIVKTGGYTRWNVYLENYLDGDYIESIIEMKKLKKIGKTEEEAIKIIEAKWEEKQQELAKFSEWDFEDFFLDIFPEKRLGKIQVKTPVKFKPGVYTFKVNLTYDPKISRRIQLDAKHSLYDLHLMIQEAFDFENDHLYCFYMDGKRYSKIRFNDPRGEEPPYVDECILGESEHLSPHKKILYLFDYGDSWWFDIVLEKIEAGILEQEDGEIIESIGESPQQYPDWEEEE